MNSSLHKGYPSLNNDAEVNGWMQRCGRRSCGQNIEIYPRPFGMGAEDFSYMAEAAPGAMFMLGATGRGRRRPSHADLCHRRRCPATGHGHAG